MGKLLITMQGKKSAHLRRTDKTMGKSIEDRNTEIVDANFDAILKLIKELKDTVKKQGKDIERLKKARDRQILLGRGL